MNFHNNRAYTWRVRKEEEAEYGLWCGGKTVVIYTARKQTISRWCLRVN
jgi:hypothetical protein